MVAIQSSTRKFSRARIGARRGSITRLPLDADHWFYPDFVAKLRSSIMVAFEYKSTHLDNPESALKDRIGKAWESLTQRTAHPCSWKMPRARDWAARDAVLGA